jgi:hypothetical protein
VSSSSNPPFSGPPNNLPVMINNPQQVNITAEGGQQINVQKWLSAEKSEVAFEVEFPLIN